jgi:hypothetical protein
MVTALEISDLIQTTISTWHQEQKKRPADYTIVSNEIRAIRQFDHHRDDVLVVIKELTNTNCEMWHEEDKVRSANDQTVLKAIRNINPLNQHRNDLVEEIDEIFRDNVRKEDK